MVLNFMTTLGKFPKMVSIKEKKMEIVGQCFPWTLNGNIFLWEYIEITKFWSDAFI